MYPAGMSAQGRLEEKFRDSMYSVVNATFGAGIATTAAGTAYDVTTPIMTIYNKGTKDDDVIMLDQMELRCTTTNTGATSLHFQFVKRSGIVLTTGATTLTPVNMGGNATTLVASQTATIATVNFGVLVTAAAAATTDRILWRTQVRDVILVADDTVHFTFGDGVTSGHGATTTGTRSVNRIPPIWIRKGETLQIHHIAPSQSADPEWEVSSAHIEYPPRS